MVTQILMPCLFANEMTAEFHKIGNAIYNTNWLEMSVRDRKLLISFMERLKRPAKIVAESFYDVNLATFMKVGFHHLVGNNELIVCLLLLQIINTSYSLFAILKNTT